MLAFVLCSLLPPDPAGHARALARLRNLARPWANRMVVFLAAGGGDPNGPRMPDRLPPPPAYWPPPLEVPEGVEEEEEVPHDYRCGISMGLMRLPASTPTGECLPYVLSPDPSTHTYSPFSGAASALPLRSSSVPPLYFAFTHSHHIAHSTVVAFRQEPFPPVLFSLPSTLSSQARRSTTSPCALGSRSRAPTPRTRFAPSPSSSCTQTCTSATKSRGGSPQSRATETAQPDLAMARAGQGVARAGPKVGLAAAGEHRPSLAWAVASRGVELRAERARSAWGLGRAIRCRGMVRRSRVRTAGTGGGAARCLWGRAPVGTVRQGMTRRGTAQGAVGGRPKCTLGWRAQQGSRRCRLVRGMRLRGARARTRPSLHACARRGRRPAAEFEARHAPRSCMRRPGTPTLA
jgi:hypothetical protein